MPRPQPDHRPEPAIELQETPLAAPFTAKIIDADFTVVRQGARNRRQKSLWARIKWWAKAIAITLLIGFLIPPAFLIFQAVSALN